MSTMNFYRDQAAVQQAAADAATLGNVRDRCQQAANAWTGLAERLQRADALRSVPRAGEPMAAPLGEPSENPDLGDASA